MVDTLERTPLQAVAREDLSREASFRLVRADPASAEPNDGLTLDGIGAVFNSITVVDSWEGTFEETIQPGAFKKSLRETRPKMQFDHGMHPVIGSIPIGQFDDGFPTEEADGLRVRGRLHDNWMTIPVRDAIGSGAVDGMSFRFSIVNETWHSAESRTATSPGKKLSDPEEILHGIFFPSEDGLLRRVLKELKIREVGPVVWPQYTDTSVSVRSRVTIDLADPSSLADRATQATLAHALFMTDRVRAEDVGPQSNGTPDSHPAPAEATETVQVDAAPTDEAMGPVVSDQPSGEHPTDSTETPDAERAENIAVRVNARAEAWLNSYAVESESTRSLINGFYATGEDNA
jgi:uncharacterized protein